MEQVLSNDVFRNFILKMIFKDDVKNVEVDENFHIYLVSQKILEMYNSDVKFLQNIANGIFEVAYLDAYKVLNLKNRESNLTYEEIEIYNRISSILNFQELENAVLSIDAFLEDLLKYVLEFYRYNILRKIKTVKALTSAQCASLLYNFKLFDNDFMEYDSPVNLSTLIDYYKKEMKIYEMTPIDTGAISANLSEEIIGFIKNLAGMDFDSFETLMEEIIKTDYKWSKYIVDKKNFNNVVDIGDFEEKVEMYENNSLDSLILEEVLIDDYYLNTLIDGVILTKGDNLYLDKSIINEQMVDDYYTKNLKPKK